MANTMILPEQIVDAALLLLQREIVLPATVWRQSDSDFMGTKDDTITLRVPAVVGSRSRTMRSATTLTEDEFAETSVPVQLTDHVYKLIRVTDEDLTLSIRDFASQVLQPQVRAVAEGLEQIIADTLAGANVPVGHTITFNDTADVWNDVLVPARAKLNHRKVSLDRRFLVCGTNVEAQLLRNEMFVKANESGTTSALSEATIGRKAGFTVLTSLALDPDTAYAYHPTAIAMGNVAPAIPDGASMGARRADNGFAMRYLRDYNPISVSDRSLVDAFVGATSVEQDPDGTGAQPVANQRLVKIEYTGTQGVV